MGDRANVVLREDDGRKVYLYTHWGGYKLPSVLKRALDRGERHSDSPYLARIIFSEMVRGQEDQATGFGISAWMCDNGHPLLVVDSNAGTVHEASEDDLATPTAGPWPMTAYPGVWADNGD